MTRELRPFELKEEAKMEAVLVFLNIELHHAHVAKEENLEGHAFPDDYDHTIKVLMDETERKLDLTELNLDHIPKDIEELYDGSISYSKVFSATISESLVHLLRSSY